jgi:hypothetical protein
MSELELALTRIGRDLNYPETPDLAGAVRRGLAEGRRPRPAWLQRRTLVIALAVVAVAAAAVMAVPQARSEILDWLGIGGVTIRYVEELPEAPKATEELGLGEGVSLREARERVPYRVRFPALRDLRDPGVFVREEAHQVSFLYGSEENPKLLITQADARGAMQKVLGSGTDIDFVSVRGAMGVWLSGAEHALHYRSPEGAFEPVRLAGNVLVWETLDGVTLRVEGDIPKQEALRIARSLR